MEEELRTCLYCVEWDLSDQERLLLKDEGWCKKTSRYTEVDEIQDCPFFEEMGCLGTETEGNDQ